MGPNFSGVRAGPWELQNTKALEATFKLDAQLSPIVDPARIDALSRRAQGDPKNEEISDVLSNTRGSLSVTDANAYFSPLEFTVPGAFVSFKGWYGVRTEAINFRGKLQLSSTLSQTTTGIKSALLRVLNPFLLREPALFKAPLGIECTDLFI